MTSPSQRTGWKQIHIISGMSPSQSVDHLSRGICKACLDVFPHLQRWARDERRSWQDGGLVNF